MTTKRSEWIRRADELQERIDRIFKRVNADPVYADWKQIADAISDNPRYLGNDRKFELGEIFFGILEQVYREAAAHDDEESGGPLFTGDLPEAEMLMRDMMPLSWALCAEWTPPELKNVYCVFFQSFTPEESELFLDLIRFAAEVFPAFGKRAEYPDVLEFWDNMAHHRENLRIEDDEAKSELLTVLARKQAASLEKRLREREKR